MIIGRIGDDLICGCRKCFGEYAENKRKEGIIIFPNFIVCSKCGNKRCPKATDHELECTNSNDIGQKGSVYE